QAIAEGQLERLKSPEFLRAESASRCRAPTSQAQVQTLRNPALQEGHNRARQVPRKGRAPARLQNVFSPNNWPERARPKRNASTSRDLEAHGESDEETPKSGFSAWLPMARTAFDS